MVDEQYREEARRLMDADNLNEAEENVAARLEELQEGPFLVVVDPEYEEDLTDQQKVETAGAIQALGPSRATLDGVKVYKVAEKCPECGYQQPEDLEEVTFDGD